MKSGPDLVQRFFIGPVLVIAGMVIYCGLMLLTQLPIKDIFHAIGVFVAAEAYGIIAGLFVLLGLQYIFGPRSWINRLIAKSLSRLLITSSIMTAIIIVVGIAVVIVW